MFSQTVCCNNFLIALQIQFHCSVFACAISIHKLNTGCAVFITNFNIQLAVTVIRYGDGYARVTIDVSYATRQASYYLGYRVVEGVNIYIT